MARGRKGGKGKSVQLQALKALGSMKRGGATSRPKVASPGVKGLSK